MRAKDRRGFAGGGSFSGLEWYVKVKERRKKNKLKTKNDEKVLLYKREIET